MVGGGSLDPDFSPSIFTTEELLLLLLLLEVLEELEDPFVHLMIQPSETMRKIIFATNHMVRIFVQLTEGGGCGKIEEKGVKILGRHTGRY